MILVMGASRERTRRRARPGVFSIPARAPLALLGPGAEQLDPPAPAVAELWLWAVLFG